MKCLYFCTSDRWQRNGSIFNSPNNNKRNNPHPEDAVDATSLNNDDDDDAVMVEGACNVEVRRM
jgi:hypothetical protein